MAGTYKVAVVGATGAVGQQMVACLEERRFPVHRLIPLASERSIGKKVTFMGKEIPVEVLGKDSFNGVEIALFSAGGSTSKEYAPIAAAAGAVVVDNSSAWRMDQDVPLVVPEVNPQDIGLYTKKGIIANPNCSTIQMVVVLKPLHDAAHIKRVVVSTHTINLQEQLIEKDIPFVQTHLHRLRDAALLRVVDEDDRAVLGPHIVSLPVQGRGVMAHEKGFQQLLQPHKLLHHVEHGQLHVADDEMRVPIFRDVARSVVVPAVG